MAARFDNSRLFCYSATALVPAVEGALRDVGANSIEWSSDHRSVSAWLGANLWSWGERLDVAIEESGKIRVTSTCRFPLQMLDWGKNADNCRKLLESVASRLATEGPA